MAQWGFSHSPCMERAFGWEGTGQAEMSLRALVPAKSVFVLLLLVLSSTDGVLLGRAVGSHGLRRCRGMLQGSVLQQRQLLPFLQVKDMLGTIFLSSWCPVTEIMAENFIALWKCKYLGFFFLFHGDGHIPVNCCIKKCRSQIYKVEHHPAHQCEVMKKALKKCSGRKSIWHKYCCTTRNVYLRLKEWKQSVKILLIFTVTSKTKLHLT